MKAKLNSKFRGSSSYKGYLLNLFRASPWSTSTLVEILSRRGFLVRLEDNQLFFSEGNTQDDIAYLAKFSDSNPFIPSNHSHFPYKIDFSAFAREKTLSMILHSPHLGFTTIGKDINEDPRKAFIKNKFGPKVPVKALDIGIASFVKALPICAVRTRYCCDGHDNEFPYIDFVSRVHLWWFQFLVEHFFLRNGHLASIQFEYDNGRFHDGRVTFKIQSGMNDMISIFSELHEASNLIRTEGTRKQILDLKEKYIFRLGP